jgi:predicted nuclease of predicted toxin-antitoxin system
VIWRIALDSGFVLVTKDEDFAAWSRLREPAPAVLWLRIGNLKKVELRAKLVPLLPELVERLQAAPAETEQRMHHGEAGSCHPAQSGLGCRHEKQLGRPS